MGEIINFEPRSETAIGRFLLTADQQEQKAEEERLIRLAMQKPTAKQSARARRELNLIFSSNNKEEAEALYAQGLSDVINQRKTTSTEDISKVIDQMAKGLGIVVIGALVPETSGYTPAAAFYAYVSNLAEIANHALDKFPE